MRSTHSADSADLTPKIVVIPYNGTRPASDRQNPDVIVYNLKKPWWRRKRFLFPLFLVIFSATLGGVLGARAAAAARSRKAAEEAAVTQQLVVIPVLVPEIQVEDTSLAYQSKPEVIIILNPEVVNVEAWPVKFYETAPVTIQDDTRARSSHPTTVTGETPTGGQIRLALASTVSLSDAELAQAYALHDIWLKNFYSSAPTYPTTKPKPTSTTTSASSVPLTDRSGFLTRKITATVKMEPAVVAVTVPGEDEFALPVFAAIMSAASEVATESVPTIVSSLPDPVTSRLPAAVVSMTSGKLGMSGAISVPGTVYRPATSSRVSTKSRKSRKYRISTRLIVPAILPRPSTVFSTSTAFATRTAYPPAVVVSKDPKPTTASTIASTRVIVSATSKSSSRLSVAETTTSSPKKSTRSSYSTVSKPTKLTSKKPSISKTSTKSRASISSSSTTPAAVPPTVPASSTPSSTASKSSPSSTPSTLPAPPISSKQPTHSPSSSPSASPTPSPTTTPAATSSGPSSTHYEWMDNPSSLTTITLRPPAFPTPTTITCHNNWSAWVASEHTRCPQPSHAPFRE